MYRAHLIKNKFNFLLIVLFLLFFASPFFQSDGFVFSPLLGLIYYLAIIAIIWAVIENHTEFLIVASIKTISMIMDMLAHFHLVASFEHGFHITARIVQVLLMYFLISHLFRWLISVKKVDGDTVKGGICIYIILGLGWMALYRLLYEINPNAFSQQFSDVWEIMYFSFATLTTVGYGDIVPVTSFAMMLATLEGIVGQLYLVIFVSRLVGLHIKHSD